MPGSPVTDERFIRNAKEVNTSKILIITIGDKVRNVSSSQIKVVPRFFVLIGEEPFLCKKIPPNYTFYSHFMKMLNI